LAQITLGHDPQAEKAAKRARAARTFGAAVDLFLAAKEHLRPRTLRGLRLYLKNGPHFRPLHAVPLSEISRADIAARLSALAHQQPASAIAARSAISSLYAWAIAEGWCDANPAAGLRNLPPAKSRDRVLTDAELAAVWRGCSDDDFGRIVRLLILTGARRQEIGSMAWDEYDPATGMLSLGAERTKNKRPHSVTLPLAAREIIGSVARNGRAFLFGQRGALGFTRWSAPKQALDRQLGGAVAPWTLHDLRRTTATRLADLGIQPHVIEALLNHVSGSKRGVAGTYNRSPYFAQVKTALERWSQHVLALAAGKTDSVIPLHA
jgi:integrase